MSRILNWAYKEFREILPVWIFFFVSFSLIAFTRMAAFGEYHVTPSEPPEYLLGSLLMAKAVLLVDALKKGTWRGRPLIYSTLWNTGLYFVAAMFLHHVERVVSLMRHQHLRLAEANHEVFLMMAKPTFWSIMAALLALTFGFCMLRDLIRAIGEDRFKEMFFGWHPRTRPTGIEDLRRTA
jgi:hypothetical protein